MVGFIFQRGCILFLLLVTCLLLELTRVSPVSYSRRGEVGSTRACGACVCTGSGGGYECFRNPGSEEKLLYHAFGVGH